MESMTSLNFMPDDLHHIFEVLAGILHLGNVKFKETGKTLSVANIEILQLVCSLWGVDESSMKVALTINRETYIQKQDHSYTEMEAMVRHI